MTEPLAGCCYCGSCSTCTGTLPSPPVADPQVFSQRAIKQRMLERISSTEIDSNRPLRALSTRDDKDPAIALIDAFASSLHILAWNAARLYDDGTILRTEDRDALVDLTRLLGYEPRPALAATTTLSFTLDNSEGSPKVAIVPKGAKIASIPKQNEKPQTFETDAEFEARAEWNELKPVPQQKFQKISKGTNFIVIDGTSTTAKTGDVVLLIYPEHKQASWLCARISNVTRKPNLQPQQTWIDLTSQFTLGTKETSKDGSWEKSPFKNKVIIFGQRAAAFGAGAPDLELMPADVISAQKSQETPPEWSGLVMSKNGSPDGGKIDLDAVYADAIPGRFIFFTKGGADTKGGGDAADNQIGLIEGVVEHNRHGFGLSAKVSQIDISGIDLSKSKTSFLEKVRETAIYIETARETLLISDDDVELPGVFPDRLTIVGKPMLPVGRRIVLTGEQWTASPGSGPAVGEIATLRSSEPSGENTLLVFEHNITERFRSTTLRLLANCVGASHGETPAGDPELVGSAKTSALSPRYQLKGTPLTYVPASNSRGYAPAIEVRVDDRLYSEQPTIFGLESSDRAYTVKQVRGEKFEVQFAGRLPTGTHNISARYRVGGGTAGNLAANRLTTAMAPIMGVRAVNNPIPADGASDAETIEDMRSAAPQSIRTLDRAVSLADFEAFARSFRGIGKAIATQLDVGMRSVVCLTIANSDLTSPVAGSEIIESLRLALALVMAPGRSVRIEGFNDSIARLLVALAIDPARRRSDVEAAVRIALGKQFGRAARNFGEALHRSAILAAVQAVDGVVAARLVDFSVPDGPPESEGRLLCPAPTMSGGVFTKAGLLSVDPGQIQFVEMQP
jgi:Baseplate J-like protein